MTFTESVTKCVRKYGTFKGRAGRSEYWWFALFAFLIEWPLFLAELETGIIYQVLGFFYFVMTLAIFVPQLAVFTRRLHDIGKSGWNWLWIILPIIGLIRLFFLLKKKGDEGPNKYGDPDNEPFTPHDQRVSIDPEPAEKNDEEAESSTEEKEPVNG